MPGGRVASFSRQVHALMTTILLWLEGHSGILEGCPNTPRLQKLNHKASIFESPVEPLGLQSRFQAYPCQIRAGIPALDNQHVRLQDHPGLSDYPTGSARNAHLSFKKTSQCLQNVSRQSLRVLGARPLSQAKTIIPHSPGRPVQPLTDCGALA